MKKFLLVALLAAACSREKPAPAGVAGHAPKAPAPAQTATAPAPASAPVTASAAPDYQKAVDHFRSSPGFHFEMSLGNAKASGDVSRARVGEERVRFRSNNDEWIAARHLAGIAWYRNGKRDAKEPAFADQVYQWVTVLLDPEKSPPQSKGTETIDGVACEHLQFRNLNNNETSDAWVAKSDNHLVRLKTSGVGNAFPPMEMTVSRDGENVTIEEPKR